MIEPKAIQSKRWKLGTSMNLWFDTGMTEVRSVGRTYTWSNGRTCSKIDRAVVNAEWILSMSQLEIMVMNPGSSDHSPLSPELDSNMRVSHKSFKFFNCIAEHPEFLQRVRVAWNGGHKGDLKAVWQKLKKVKASIKQLNNSAFKGVSSKVKDIREKLQYIHEIMRDPLTIAHNRQHEKELQLQLEKWSLIEESAIQQKSKVQWLKLGDANTAYFVAHMKNRVAQTQLPVS